MQDCFRAHPDVYGAELEDEEDEIDEELKAQGLSREPGSEKPQHVAEKSQEAPTESTPHKEEPEAKSS